MIEHGAYRLLLDYIYDKEHGIPADRVYRETRARTKEERAAVDVVLAEYFTLVDGAYINERAAKEIEKAQVKIEASKNNGRKGGRPRKRVLGSENETQEKPTGLLLGSENKTQPKAHQTPDTRHQTPDLKTNPIAQTTTSSPRDPMNDRALELAVLLRGRGASLNATDPRLREWAEHGVSDAQALTALDSAERQRTAKRDTSPINAGYLDSILRNQLTEATRPKVESIYDRRAKTIAAFTGGPNADRSDPSIPF
jgi:uncharacterized protein YdaU (DUF1376 family)